MSQSALDLAAREGIAYLERLKEQSVSAEVSFEQLRAKLRREFPFQGTEPDEVVRHLITATSGGHLGSAGGRFFAWVIGGAVQSAVAADWLTACWDQNAALSVCAPAAAVAEEVAGEWIKQLLELPESASFALTNGCQLAHVTCLAAARYRVLNKLGYDVAQEGLYSAPRISVLIGEHHHRSIERALRLLGMGTQNIAVISSNHQERMDETALRDLLDRTSGPKIVVLSAADINTGSFDDFQKLIPIAKAQDAWVHVDGAFGLFARASSQHRHWLDGVESADSWTTDGHKWLNVPFDSGIAVVADQEAHRNSLQIDASYVSSNEEARDQMDWNLEWSRRARGFALYAALMELGKSGVAALVERTCRLAQRLVDGLAANPAVKVLWRPHLNQGLVRFIDVIQPEIDQHNDRYTDDCIQAINETGEAFFSGTTWKGRRAMRISLVNWRTDESDIDRAIKAIESVLGRSAKHE